MSAQSVAPAVPTARHRLARPAIAWFLTVAGLSMFVTFAVVYFSPVTPRPLYDASGGAITAFWLFPFAAIAPVGLLIALRRSSNAIGWLALSAIFLLGVGSLASLVGAILTNEHNTLGAYVILLAAFWNAPGGGVETVLFVMLLLFPDGHLPSPRWRWLLYFVIAVGSIGFVLILIDPTPGALGITAIPTHAVVLPISMLGITAAAAAVNTLVTVVNLASYAGAAAVIASIFLRLRGADADRRHQIKWVAVAALVTIATIVGLNSVPIGNTVEAPPLYVAIAGPILIVAGLAVPVAIGIAVLKYRLYDIDLIINRALVYGALAVLITAVYIGIAVGIGTLVGSGGQPNLWLSIVATIIVAVGFQPVRERLQRIANRLVYGKRATPYEVLSEFSEQVAATYASDEILPRMARILQEGAGAESATVWLCSGAYLRPATTFPESLTEHEPLLMSNGAIPEIPGAASAVRVEHQGELLGVLTLTKRKGESLSPTEEKLISDLAHQAGLVLRNVGLTAELRQRLEDLRRSRQRLVQAQDEERRRLERNLHDGAQQHLVAIKVKLGLAQMLVARAPEKAKEAVTALKSDADEALETLRDLARGIYPPLLADKGLVVALESQARKATLPVRVEADGLGRYAQDVEATVYFCVLEALQNVQKYANASEVVVRLHEREGKLAFEVADDGAGFDAQTAKSGAGLTNMSDRVDALGGTLEVMSHPGAGTCVRGALPAPARVASLA
jgi:signal transduction histidine kinase